VIAITEALGIIFYTQTRETNSICSPEKGKPSERMGRKATGLNPFWRRQPGCREVRAPPMVFNHQWSHGGAYGIRTHFGAKTKQGIIAYLDACAGSADCIDDYFSDVC